MIKNEYIDIDIVGEIADILNQLDNKDQVELFRFFHKMYQREDARTYPLEGIMHVLNKLVFEDQQQVVQFFMDVYDPEVKLKK